VHDLRPRVGIRRALIERVKCNLELDGVDTAAISACMAELEVTRAEFAAALAQNGRELAAAHETLAAHAALTDAIVPHLELGQPGTSHLAGPAMLERVLALRYWLAEQPPSDLTVSVIIPTRSRPAFVREAIASVQAQSHARWEAIVVDDGSEDDTRTTLAAIDDDRVRCLRTDGLGPPGARSAGLELASGEAIAYLDDDNIMLPGWLASVAWAFSRYDDVDVLYGARVVEDETPIGSDARLPRLVFSHFDRSRLLDANYIDTNVIAHRADLAQARWDPELAGIADWDLMIRLTEDKPALALPVAAALYRTGAPGRMSHRAQARAAEQKLRARLSVNQR
jgi:Glycosyl transferase family 2